MVIVLIQELNTIVTLYLVRVNNKKQYRALGMRLFACLRDNYAPFRMRNAILRNPLNVHVLREFV